MKSINVTSLTHAGHTFEHIGVVTHFVTMHVASFFVLEGVRGCGRLLPKKFLTTKKKRKKKNKKKIGTCLSRYVFSIPINTSHSADWIKKWVMFYTKLEDIPLLVLTPVAHFL